MSDCGKRIRLHRIFRGPKRRALVVAFDHALVLGPIPGTTSPKSVIQCFGDNGSDAVLLNFGMLQQAFASLLVPTPPALVVRLDWTSVWGPQGTDGKAFSKLLGTPEEALRKGADAVLTYLIIGTGDPEFEASEVARNAEVARECERLGIPLIVESLARGKDVANPLSSEWMKLHTRMAAELGADVIKTEYTGDPESMAEIVDICPIPILVLGGERRAKEKEALAVVAGAVHAGAAGVFFGRNVFQSSNVGGFLRSVRAVLDADAEGRAGAGK